MVADGYKDTEVGVIPVEWDVMKLKDVIVNTQLGVNVKASLDTDGIKLLKMGNLTKGGFNFNKLEKTNDTIENLENYYLKYGDFLFNTRNTPQIVGKSAVWKWNKNDVIFNSNIMRISFSENINSFFYSNYFASDIGWKKLKKISKGTTSVGAIYTKDLITVKIPLPPLKEQEKIADILSTADDKIDAIASQIDKAQTLKKGLLQKLLSEGIGHSEFKDSGLSIVYPMRKIPNAWQLKTLSDITTKITDGAHFTPTYVDKGIPFLRVTDLKSKDILASEIKYIPENEHIELLKRCKPEYGDILYSKNGTIGLTRIITWDWEFSIFVSLCLIKPNKELIIPEYLAYYLQSNIVNTQIKIRSKQGTVTNLHLEEIRDFFVTIPPLEEQKQIAEILSTADEKLEVLKAKKEKYETLKKGLLQKLLSGEVRV